MQSTYTRAANNIAQTNSRHPSPAMLLQPTSTHRAQQQGAATCNQRHNDAEYTANHRHPLVPPHLLTDKHVPTTATAVGATVVIAAAAAVTVLMKRRHEFNIKPAKKIRSHDTVFLT